MSLTGETIFYIVQSIICFSSTVACLIILILYSCSNSLNIYSFKFVFHLTLQNLFKSATLLIPEQINNISPLSCKLSAYLFYGSSVSSTIWTFFIAFNLYQVIFLKCLDSEKRFKYFMFISLFLPYAFCAIPFYFDLYGPTGVNCLMKDNDIGNIFRLSLYYFPAFLVISACLWIYVKIFKTFHSDVVNTEGERDIMRLLYFPLILIICVIPALVARSMEYFGYENFYVWLFSSCIWSLQGLLDVAAYALTPPIIRSIRINFTTDTSLIETKSS